MPSDPQSGYSLQDAFATAKSVWQAFIVPASLAAWAVYRAVTGRQDQRRDEADKSKRDLAEIATRDRQQLSTEVNGMLDRLNTEIGRLNARAQECDRERDRWERLAQDWRTAFRKRGHDMSGLQMRIVGLMRELGQPEPVFPEIVTPDLEDPQ